MQSSSPQTHHGVDQRPRLRVVVPLLAICLLVTGLIVFDLFKFSPHKNSDAKLSPADPELILEESPARMTNGAPIRSPAPSRPSRLATRLGSAIDARSAAGDPSVSAVPSQRGSTVPTSSAIAAPRQGPTFVSAAVRGSNHLGQIVGKISFQGIPPPEVAIPLDPSCGRLHTNQLSTRFYLVDSKGGLADVFVYIQGGLEGKAFPAPTKPATLDQKNCEYVPYVLGLQVGQKLLVSNSDPLLHNVHPTPTVLGNAESNKAQPHGSKPFEYIFSQPELFLRFKCDVHNWMFAYVSVLPHPFFSVSDRSGAYALLDVPPGRYTMVAVHRKAGQQSREINLSRGGQVEANFTFTLPVPEASAQAKFVSDR